MANELRWVGQSGCAVLKFNLQLAVYDAIRDRVNMRSARKRVSTIEKSPAASDNYRATSWVVGCSSFRAVIIRYHVRAIQRVIKTPPPGVRCIKRKACVHHGNHQLGTWHRRYLGVNVLRHDLELVRLRQQIADLC